MGASRSHKTAAIVLKRLDLGEADRLLTLFTLEKGKIRAINRGGRKVLSKLAGHLEPFSLSHCQLEEGRQFYTITAADLQEGFPAIRRQLGRTGEAYCLLEMVDALTIDEVAQPSVYRLLAAALELLADGRRLLHSAFTLKLLAEVGYQPDLHQCGQCQRRLEPTGLGYSRALAGLVCEHCHDGAGDNLLVSSTAVKAMRLILEQPLDIIDRITADRSLTAELEAITGHYLNYHTGRELRSLNFMRQANLDRQV